MKKLTKQEVSEILQQHKLWLRSCREEGNKADLSNIDLSFVDFSETNLKESNFRGANLAKAKLDDTVWT